MQRFSLGAVVLACAVLVGCGSPIARKLVGTWKCDPVASLQNEMQAKDNNPLKAFVQAQLILELVIRDTGTMTMHMGPQRREVWSKKWIVTGSQGNTATVQLSTLDNTNPEAVPITFTDNDHFLFTPPNTDRQLTFARVTQP